MQIIDATNQERHICTGRKAGNNIVFTCSECSYERIVDVKGNMKVIDHGEDGILHEGMYYPTGIDSKLFNLN